MDSSHLQELTELEDNYWWHVAKRRLACGLLSRFAPPPGRLIEGGVGSCRNLLEFQRRGYDVAGLDVMSEAVQLAHQRGIEQVYEHDLAEPWPFDAGSARAVVMLDVIEHVEDPLAPLRNAYETLTDGGALIVTVPAYEWLRGDWDDALGHFRRYDARQLRKHAREAGFDVQLLKHWNAFTLPAAVAVRSYQRLRPGRTAAEFPRVAPWTNRMLLHCAGVERWLIDRVPVPCGLSLVGVLTK